MIGWEELYFFEAVLMRMSGFVLFNPILGRNNIPGYVKAGIILVLLGLKILLEHLGILA